MSYTDLRDFEPEYTQMIERLGRRIQVQIEKLGGGTVGHAYEGTWRYRLVSDLTLRILAQGQDLITGTPKTHQQAAELVVQFVYPQREGWKS